MSVYVIDSGVNFFVVAQVDSRHPVGLLAVEVHEREVGVGSPEILQVICVHKMDVGNLCVGNVERVDFSEGETGRVPLSGSR